MNDIIERLKIEKLDLENKWFQTGKDEGLEFAKSADYETLQFALKHELFEDIMRRERNIIGYDPSSDGMLGDYFSEILDHYEAEGMGFDETAYNHYIPNGIYIEWESGWVEGVNEFWGEVKDKL